MAWAKFHHRFRQLILLTLNHLAPRSLYLKLQEKICTLQNHSEFLNYSDLIAIVMEYQLALTCESLKLLIEFS